MPGEAALVMFAIRSAVKLGQQSRAAYVDATRRRELVLPLPGFPATITVDDAGGYFLGEGARHVAARSRLAELVARWKGRDPLSPDEQRELMTLRREAFVADLAEAGVPVVAADASVVAPEDLNALLAVRQWARRDDPTPSALQRAGATLIEIGVDYAARVPGALGAGSTTAKVAEAVLLGLESVKASEVPVPDLPARVFVATLETVSSEPGLLTGDPKVQELVRVTARGLAQDVGGRIAAMRAGGDSDSAREERVAEWGELMLRSILASGGGMVLADPEVFLGIEPAGEAAFVSDVGSAVLGLVLDAPDGGLTRAFSRESVDTVLKAALGVAARHPELLVAREDRGLRALLASIAEELGRYDTRATTGILPELTRSILARTGEHLDLLWPSASTDPRAHLLLAAAKTTLAVLTAAPPAGARWKQTLGRDDVLAVTGAAFDELIQNPSWLVAAAGDGDRSLETALVAAVDVLRVRATPRLSAATAVEVLKAALHAAAVRAEFFDRMPAGAAAGKPVLAAALDAMLATIFEPAGARAAWRLTRAEAVTGIVRAGLDELARRGPTAGRVGRLETALRAQAAAIEAGDAWDLGIFADGVREALARA